MDKNWIDGAEWLLKEPAPSYKLKRCVALRVTLSGDEAKRIQVMLGDGSLAWVPEQGTLTHQPAE